MTELKRAPGPVRQMGWYGTADPLRHYYSCAGCAPARPRYAARGPRSDREGSSQLALALAPAARIRHVGRRWRPADRGRRRSVDRAGAKERRSPDEDEHAQAESAAVPSARSGLIEGEPGFAPGPDVRVDRARDRFGVAAA